MTPDEAWNLGYDWAYNLRLGDKYRVPHEEARHQNIPEDLQYQFCRGALMALEGWDFIGLSRTNHISKLVAR